MKTCRRCLVEKSIEAFNKAPRNRDGLQSWCKDCGKTSSRESNRRIYVANPEQQREKSRRWRAENPEKVREASSRHYVENKEAYQAREKVRKLRKYGLTEEAFSQMSAEQGGVCGICKEPPSSHRDLAVDHCHETGRVRGLLCARCNTAIGYLNDDPIRAERLAAYLIGD